MLQLEKKIVKGMMIVATVMVLTTSLILSTEVKAATKSSITNVTLRVSKSKMIKINGKIQSVQSSRKSVCTVKKTAKNKFKLTAKKPGKVVVKIKTTKGTKKYKVTVLRKNDIDTTESNTTDSTNNDVTFNTTDNGQCNHVFETVTTVETLYENVYHEGYYEDVMVDYYWKFGAFLDNYLGAPMDDLYKEWTGLDDLDMPEGIYERGAVFENVELKYGYFFPDELFFPRDTPLQYINYNNYWLSVSDEMKNEAKAYWESDKGKENLQKAEENLENYRTKYYEWIRRNQMPEIGYFNSCDMYEVMNDILLHQLRTKGYYDLCSDGNYTSLYNEKKEYRDYTYKGISVFSRYNAAYSNVMIEQYLVGNEMLWDYFYPGVEHEWGEPIKVPGQIYHPGYNEVVPVEKKVSHEVCKLCGLRL